ncbi:MAG: hypothetical protein GYA39_03605 [Methanothrix sp.]|nr:hypothetical protein [Methanothrix sp.]
MNEDEILLRITKFLEQGCTMLATHHDCGAPLFRCHGEIVCPVCSVDVDQGSTKEISRSAASQQPEALKTLSGDIAPEDDLVQAKTHLRAVLIRKLEMLIKGLEQEQDLDKLKKQLDCIEGLLKAFRAMSR